MAKQMEVLDVWGWKHIPLYSWKLRVRRLFQLLTVEAALSMSSIAICNGLLDFRWSCWSGIWAEVKNLIYPKWTPESFCPLLHGSPGSLKWISSGRSHLPSCKGCKAVAFYQGLLGLVTQEDLEQQGGQNTNSNSSNKNILGTLVFKIYARPIALV